MSFSVHKGVVIGETQTAGEYASSVNEECHQICQIFRGVKEQ